MAQVFLNFQIMKLINYEDYQIKVAEEALLVRPIRRLFNQDRTDKKEKFFQQMSYLYFMTDPRSTYSYILDYNERHRTVVEQEGLPEDFRPSELLVEAMRIYKQHTMTVSQKLLDDALVAANTVGSFLKNVDLTEVDDKGRPKYQVSQITTALKNLEGIVATIQNLQKKVEQEVVENGKARGTQEMTVGDYGLD